MGELKDIRGQRFGRLTVLEEDGRDKHGNVMWKCKCECGNTTCVSTSSLKNGHTRSCGCLMRERIGNMRRKDGRSSKHLYHLYYSVKQRCYNPKDTNYKYYGGRGIAVCEEWQTWEAFEEWAMSHGYQYGLTLDRIDVNGNYEPSNCRWISQAEQMRNTRKTRYLTYNGETRPLIEWCEIFDVSFNTASARFTRGWSNPHEILFGRMKGVKVNG